MSLRTSATRYAKALFDVALAQSDPAQVERDLAAIADAFSTHDELRRVLTSPGTPHAARVNIVKALIERATPQPMVARLVTMLADRGRLDLLPVILVVYRERLMAHNNIVRASVTSAMPLSADTERQLAARLEHLTGKRVELESSVDPSIIGGVIARVGGTVYDGSIRTQLDKLRHRLTENV
jgi:F-type H+-transporting ATPase subunit delta